MDASTWYAKSDRTRPHAQSSRRSRWSRAQWRRRKWALYNTQYFGRGEGTDQMVGSLNTEHKDRCIYVVRVPRFLGEFLDRAVEDELKAAADYASGKSEEVRMGAGRTIGRLRIPVGSLAKSNFGIKQELAAAADGFSDSEAVAQVQLDEHTLQSLATGESTDRTSHSHAARVPTRYDLRFHLENPNMQVFSIDPEDELGQARVEGTVAYVGSLQPHLDDAFREMHRHRAATHQTTLRRENKRIRQVSVEDMRREELRRMRPDAEMGSVDSQARKDARVAASHRTPGDLAAGSVRRVNETEDLVGVGRAAQEIEARYTSDLQKRQQLRDAKRHGGTVHLAHDLPDREWRETAMKTLFELFEKQHWWRLSDLLETTGLPTGLLKPLVSELCEYNNRGPYRGMYELRDQYKTQTQRNLMDIQFKQRQAEMEVARLEREKDRENRKRERDSEQRAARRAQLASAAEIDVLGIHHGSHDDEIDNQEGNEQDYGYED